MACRIFPWRLFPTPGVTHSSPWNTLVEIFPLLQNPCSWNTNGKSLYPKGFTQCCDMECPPLYFEITNLLLIGQRAMVLVSEIRHQSPERGHLPTAILCHHYNVTIEGSMCVQVGNPPTWLPLHHFLQLSQKWNALHTQLLTNIFWLPHLSGSKTEVNPDNRFNVLSPLMDASAIIPVWEQTTVLPAPFCVKYGRIWIWTS